MKVRIQLFGALREASPDGYIELNLPDRGNIASARKVLLEHLAEHAPQVRANLVRRSAFASDDAILRDHDALPEDGKLAVLPPVSGG